MGYSIPDDHGLVVITITGAGVGQPDTIRFGLEYIDAAAMVQADFNRIANLFRDGLKPMLDPTWTFGPVKQYYKIGASLFLSEDPTQEVGTGAGGSYASDQVAYIIQKKTAIVGRAFRGRAYLPGVLEAAVDQAGNITGATIAGFNTILSTMYTALAADPAINSLVLLHVEPTADLPTQIQSLSIAAKCGTVRRRIRR